MGHVFTVQIYNVFECVCVDWENKTAESLNLYQTHNYNYPYHIGLYPIQWCFYNNNEKSKT